MVPSGVKVKVLYWAQARELAGTASDLLKLHDPADIPTLMEAILEKHPKLAELRQSMKIAVNGKIGGPEVTLKEGDEVALLPPVSGG